MPPLCRPPPALRWAQALCCMLAISTAGLAGHWLPGEVVSSMTIWTVSLAFSLLMGAVEAFTCTPPCRNIPLILATIAAMACAAASVIWPLGHLHPGGDHQALQAMATAASVLATLAYAAEVVRDWDHLGQTAPFLATPPGLLKVGETMVALLLLGLAMEQRASEGPPGWRWCLGIYCVSLIVGVPMLLLVGLLRVCGALDPVATRRWLVVYTALGVVGYGVASVLWPLYAFWGQLGGVPERPEGCEANCYWDRWVLVSVATALNLVAFVVDLVQTGRLMLRPGVSALKELTHESWEDFKKK